MNTLCPEDFSNNGVDDFSKSFMYSVHQMHFLVQKHLEQVLLKHKCLTFSQFMILVGFKCSKSNSGSTLSGSVSQTQIAAELDLTEATVSRHIGTLVKLGYVKREEDKNNRRKHILSITTKGMNVFKKAKEVIDAELTTLFSVINKNDRDSIMKNFQAVLNLLNKK